MWGKVEKYIYIVLIYLFIYLSVYLFIYLFINIYSSESLENAFLEATKSVFKFLFNAFVILVKKLISVVKHNLARNLYSLLHASNYDKFTVNQIVKLITPFFTQFFEKKKLWWFIMLIFNDLFGSID